MQFYPTALPCCPGAAPTTLCRESRRRGGLHHETCKTCCLDQLQARLRPNSPRLRSHLCLYAIVLQSSAGMPRRVLVTVIDHFRRSVHLFGCQGRYHKSRLARPQHGLFLRVAHQIEHARAFDASVRSCSLQTTAIAPGLSRRGARSGHSARRMPRGVAPSSCCSSAL